MDGSTCTFAVQTVFCGNITGNLSNIINIAHLHYNSVQNHSTCAGRTNCAGAIVSASLLALIVLVCAASFTIVATIVGKHKQRDSTMGFSVTSGIYETARTDRSPAAIDTQENIAYGHAL